MCSQNQTVSAMPSSSTSSTLALQQALGTQIDHHHHHHHHHHHGHHSSQSHHSGIHQHHNTTSPLNCGVGSSLLGTLGGSTMLSPPLSGNLFNTQSAYDWLSSSSPLSLSIGGKNTSASAEKRSSIGNISQNCGGTTTCSSGSISSSSVYSTEKKNMSSCRYNQEQQNSSDSFNLMAMFNVGLNADTVLSRSSSSSSSSHNYADTVSLSHQHQQKQKHHSHSHHAQQQLHQHQHQQQHSSVATSTGSQLYNSHFASSTAAAAAAVVAAAATPYHLQQGHGLPSPTIYPPTPPPSAPWIHPWYAGDNF